MATIRDVASRAGVAISTASAAINRSAPVSPEVIAKVEAAIRETGYVPHGAARSLRNGRSQLIGLVVPNIANPWCGAVAREVENVCLSAGYTSVIYSTGQDAKRESQVLDVMHVQRVAGLIVIPTRSDAEHGRRLNTQIRVPTVLLDMYVDGLPYDVIKTDNVAVGRLATEHLLAEGHRRIAIVVGIPGLATSDDRHAGYLAAHETLGLAPDPALAVSGDFDQSVAFERGLALLDLTPRPTAVVTISNMMTIGMLSAIRTHKLGIPDDISIVGVDDLEFSTIIDPPLTVVEPPILHMARRSIELLIDQIEGRKTPTGDREIHQPILIVRGSTRPPAKFASGQEAT